MEQVETPSGEAPATTAPPNGRSFALFIHPPPTIFRRRHGSGLRADTDTQKDVGLGRLISLPSFRTLPAGGRAACPREAKLAGGAVAGASSPLGVSSKPTGRIQPRNSPVLPFPARAEHEKARKPAKPDTKDTPVLRGTKPPPRLSCFEGLSCVFVFGRRPPRHCGTLIETT